MPIPAPVQAPPPPPPSGGDLREQHRPTPVRRTTGALLGGAAALLVTAAAPLPPGPDPKSEVHTEINQAYEPAKVMVPGQKFTVAYNFFHTGPGTADKIVAEARLPAGLTLLHPGGGPCREPEENHLRCEFTDPGQPGKDLFAYAVPSFQVDKDVLTKGGKDVALSADLTISSWRDGAVSDSSNLRRTMRIKPAPVYPAPTDPSVFPQSRTATWHPLPSAKAEQERLGRWHKWPEYRPTGFHLNAGQDLTVDVRQTEPGDPLPQLVIGNHALIDTTEPGTDLPEPRTYDLKPGKNTINDYRGGPVNYRYVDDRPNPQEHPVTVTLGEEAHPMPYYELGRTTGKQWRAMLAAATSPYAQLASKRVHLTVKSETAREHATADQDELLRTYDTLSEAEDAISNVGGRDPGAAAASQLPQQIVEFRTGGTANAADHRVAWPTDWGSGELLTADGLKKSWGLWHELGHQRQMAKWTWRAMQEQTVNIYSLAADRRLPGTQSAHATPAEWKLALEYLELPDAERDFDAAGGGTMQGSKYHFGRFAMFEQLRVLFGDDFYQRLHAAARPATMAAAGDDAARKRFFMVEASRAAGRDLTAYFTAWGLRPDGAAKQAIASLGLPQAEARLARTNPYAKGGM
ncbi:M60 family metallopeptidase [Streptomyces monticola]|uniref:M60 family metallopeptidase n=1 Tax=Streptomyces monticola TaxID=2666263 RepID=A0ABW2JTD3_9ACTN